MEIREISQEGTPANIYTNGIYYMEYIDDELFSYKIIDKWDKYELVELMNYIPYSDFWTNCEKATTKRRAFNWNPNKEQFPTRSQLESIVSSSEEHSETMKSSYSQNKQPPRAQQQEGLKPLQQSQQSQQPSESQLPLQHSVKHTQKGQQKPPSQGRSINSQRGQAPQFQKEPLTLKQQPATLKQKQHYSKPSQKGQGLLPLPLQLPLQPQEQIQKDQPHLQHSLQLKNRKASQNAQGNPHLQHQRHSYPQQQPQGSPLQKCLTQLSHLPLSLAATSLQPLGVVLVQASYQRQKVSF